MCSPSALIRVNYQIMRYLHFRNARGDLLEGHVCDKRLRGYAFRYQFPPFPVPIPILPSTKTGFLCFFCLWTPPFSRFSSTKSGFLCFFGLRRPYFLAFRAQNRGFCALLPSGTPVFGLSEHKIGIFVRFRRYCGHHIVTKAMLRRFRHN